MGNADHGDERTERRVANQIDEQERAEYERPETVRMGPIAEITRGSGPASLDGPYGPGWQKYEG